MRRLDQRDLRRRTAVHSARLHRPGLERRRSAACLGQNRRCLRQLTSLRQVLKCGSARRFVRQTVGSQKVGTLPNPDQTRTLKLSFNQSTLFLLSPFVITFCSTATSSLVTLNPSHEQLSNMRPAVSFSALRSRPLPPANHTSFTRTNLYRQWSFHCQGCEVFHLRCGDQFLADHWPKNYPTGLALDGQGSLYVVDRNNNSIGKYTESGAIINASLLTYSTPSGIAYDGQGHLFVARTEPGSIGEFSTSGAPVSVPFATGLFNPDGVAFFDGKVYALDGNAIYIYNTAGTLLNTIAASTPWGICFDDSGHMFVPRQGFGAIAEYTTSGTLINNNLITGLSYPVYTGFDGQNLYVAELNNGNSRIGKYTTSGTPINPNLITGIDHFNTMVVAPEPSFVAFGLLSLVALRFVGRAAHARFELSAVSGSEITGRNQPRRRRRHGQRQHSLPESGTLALMAQARR